MSLLHDSYLGGHIEWEEDDLDDAYLRFEHVVNSSSYSAVALELASAAATWLVSLDLVDLDSSIDHIVL